VYGVYFDFWERGTASVFRVQFQADFDVTGRRKIISHMGQFEGISANRSYGIGKRGYDLHQANES